MRKVLSLLLVLVCLFGVASGLVSCGAPEDAGAEISVYLGEPIYDFDPTDYYADSNADQFMSLLFEPLFYIDEDGDLEFAAAEDYDVDEEKRTIVIELRESFWSDGSQVKAEDFIYTWRDILLDPNNPNPAAALLYDIENAVEIKQGSKEISKFELGAKASLFEITITYREGADYEQLLRNLASLATSPIRQDAASVAPTYWSKTTSTIVTNGPFKLTSVNYITGEIVLDRNMGYHQRTTIEDFDNNVVPSKLLGIMNTEMAGEITYADLVSKTVFYMSDASLVDRAASKNKAVVADDLSTHTYVFNTENPLFANKDVRYALSLAVDRAAIANAIVYAKPASGFLPDPMTKSIKQSLIAAESSMAEAKRIISGVDFGVLEKSFSITVNNDEESMMIAELVKANWEELGFTVTLNPVSTVTTTVKDFMSDSDMELTDSQIQVYLKEAAYGNIMYDVLAIDWQMYSDDPFAALAAFSTTMNGCGAEFDDEIVTLRKNIAGWSNATYDEYVKMAYSGKDESVRNQYLKKAEALLVSEAPVVPIVFNQNFAYVSDALSEVKVNGFGNFVLNMVEQENYQQYIVKNEED